MKSKKIKFLVQKVVEEEEVFQRHFQQRHLSLLVTQSIALIYGCKPWKKTIYGVDMIMKEGRKNFSINFQPPSLKHIQMTSMKMKISLVRN